MKSTEIMCKNLQEELNDKIEKLEKSKVELETSIKQDMKKSLTTASTPSQPSPTSIVKETVSNATSEMKDKERRKNNIVIYNMEEHETNLKSESERLDTEKICEISNKVLEINLKSSDFNTLRIGKKQTGQRRPILVKLKHEESKTSIMSNLKRLKGSPYEGIGFAHDLTKLERVEYNKLKDERKELESKKEDQHITFKIVGQPWNWKIIKTQKHANRPGNPQ